MGNELAMSDNSGAIAVQQQVNQIQNLMSMSLKDGEHYGTVPGCGNKPTLLQPGAEKIALMFNWAPTYNITRDDLGNGHREYTVECTLANRETGMVMGVGVGECSTMESKYRYRNVSDYVITDMEIPQDARERKAEYRKQGFGMKKVDGIWYWVHYEDSGKQENPDIADTWNTVLKMAKKRAFVDAVKSTAAASDIFTQDIEDMTPYVKPKVDPRDAAWAEVGNLKDAVIAGGTSEEGIRSWMDAAILNDDGTPKKLKEYTIDDVNAVKTYLEDMLESQNLLEQELADTDIDF